MQDEQLVSKLRHFVDENPKIYVDSKDCELTIYDKEKVASKVPTESISTRFSGELPGTRDKHNSRFFYHGGGQFNSNRELFFTFNINRSHKYTKPTNNNT